jgi:rhamnulose-1-phosphate aldolase
MGATTELMRTHRAVIWQRHGIVTRSDVSLQKAGDLVEYAEAAAHFEYLNLQLGEPSKGIPFENLRLICEHWKVSASILDCIINV